MMKHLLIAVTAACVPLVSQAQKSQVKEGNRLYVEKNYVAAAAAYQKALQKNPKYAPGIFNLGNALYQQKNYGGSRQALTALSKTSDDKKMVADAHYNIGNTYMEEKKWQEAVDAYKQALRRNPSDEAAKYNLSYALQMLKKEQGGGGNKDKNKDQQQQQDQKDQNQQDQNQDKDQQQNKDQQDQQDKKEEPQQSKLSEQQAEQLLNALSQEEKKLHEKKEKGRPARIKVDKDW